jgi:hypothetical protein
MKFVRPIAALVLTLAAVACGGGEDATVESSGAGGNVVVPSKETTGAPIAVPGTNDTASANEGAQASGGAGSESGNSATPTEPTETKPADPPADPPADDQVAPKPADPVQPVAVVQKYIPAQCDADCVAHDVPGVISRASKKYNIPRWFYYAIIRRESTFDRCKTQPESAPNKDWGRGLTQVTFPWYAGVPYPQHVSNADNLQSEWRSNMGLNGALGAWIDMKDVSAIPSTPASESDCRNNPKGNDAYDPKTNLDRFSTGFAAPAYHLYHVAGEAPTETLRKVAYHWHYGLWGSWTGDYPSDPRPYLSGATGYDAHVSEYKAAVEAEDGVWSGPTCKPPYSDSGC